MTEYDELAARLTQAIMRARPLTGGGNRRFVHASDVNKCIRQVYYIMNETPIDDGKEDTVDTVNFIYEYGNMFESIISQQLQLASKFGVGYGGKVPLSDFQINVVGTTDPTIIFEGLNIITECKATNRKNYLRIIEELKQGKDASLTVETYYDQIEMYLWLHPAADLGMIIIGNRDMSYTDKLPPLIIIPVERNMEWKKVNFARINELNTGLRNNKAPRREFTPNAWQCKVCPYLDRCYGGAHSEDNAEKPNTENRGLS